MIFYIIWNIAKFRKRRNFKQTKGVNDGHLLTALSMWETSVLKSVEEADTKTKEWAAKNTIEKNASHEILQIPIGSREEVLKKKKKIKYSANLVRISSHTHKLRSDNGSKISLPTFKIFFSQAHFANFL